MIVSITLPSIGRTEIRVPMDKAEQITIEVDVPDGDKDTNQVKDETRSARQVFISTRIFVTTAKHNAVQQLPNRHLRHVATHRTHHPHSSF